jgi:predicted RNase H-like HicB family nuclease
LNKLINWLSENYLFNEEFYMLTKYLEAAMRHAHYEILSDDGTYYGEISKCRGVYANAPTLEQCRSELAQVLEDWILFRIYKNLTIPGIDGIKLTIKKEAAA